MKPFERLKDLHAGLRFPVAAHYAPGLSDTEFARCVESRGTSIGGELKELYGYANGSTANDDGLPMWQLWVFPGYYMLPLEEALDTRAYLIENDSGWRTDWLPVFSSGGTTFVVCDAAGGMSRLDPENGAATVLIDSSVHSFVDRLVRYVRHGAISKPASGIIEWFPRPWP